jgi:hypothetical protein
MKRNSVEELQKYMKARDLKMDIVAIADVATKVQTKEGLEEFREVVEAWRPLAGRRSPLSKVNMPEVLDHILVWAAECNMAKDEGNETK